MKVYLTDIQRTILFNLYKEPHCRSELVELTGIPRTTLYDNLAKLEDYGVLERYSVSDDISRRPLIYWRFKST